ncbi:MAG: DUF87 domain-containing protein [Clostridia bacterium]|nr:DUF87 domain-containing protein [Clostridia bacterium]
MRRNTEIKKILPSEVKEKYNCMKVQAKYINVMSIVSMNEVIFLEMINTLLLQEEVTISFHIYRQNGPEFLRKLARSVLESGAEIKSIKQNQLDIEVLEKNKKNAEEIKKEIQVNNEEVYIVEIYVALTANDENEVLKKSNNIKNVLYTKGIVLNPTYFKQKSGYIATLPLLQTNSTLSDYTENIMLTTTLARMFPFFENDILNENGVFIGCHEDKHIKLSLLAPQNLNYNMCVFGSSGVGKSFFIKVLIMRNFYNNVNQIIIDPEGEYKDIVLSLGGNVYDIATYNPMYIEERFAKRNEDFLADTIKLTEEYLFYRHGLENVTSQIKNEYLKYGITQEIETLYEKSREDKIYLHPKYKTNFPHIKHILDRLKIQNNLKETAGIPTTAKLHCFVLKGKNKEEINKEISVFLPKIKQLIQENTLIYFDEIWKTINANITGTFIEEIYNFFKTLRKRKAGIVAISQDIGDLFAIDDGNFGKSILNNSFTKIFFKMSYSDLEKLQGIEETLNLREKTTKLIRGEAYVLQGESKFIIRIEANDFEKNLIEKESVYEESFNSNG